MKMDDRKSFKFSTILIVAILFTITIFILCSIRKVVLEFRNVAYEEYIEQETEKFDIILDDAIELGRFGLKNSANKIQLDIEENLDMDKLEDCLLNNTPYPEFDAILRETLQKNVYTRYSDIDQNRNNIFVIINGNVVASYNHDGKIFSSPVRLGSDNKVEDIIGTKFFNVSLSQRAINMILNQYKGHLIIWQENQPKNPDIPKYTTMNRNTLHDILHKFGIEGLESYEILIPVYITEYGNIFGDIDVPGDSNTSNNKIILVQKLNLVDYIDHYYPGYFDNESNAIITSYNKVMLMINIFIILECLSMFAYAAIFIMYYNHRIITEELEQQLVKFMNESEELEEETKSEENKDN